jgi:hypothetical protein
MRRRRVIFFLIEINTQYHAIFNYLNGAKMIKLINKMFQKIPNENTSLTLKHIPNSKPQKVECKSFCFLSFKVSKLHEKIQNINSFVCTFKTEKKIFSDTCKEYQTKETEENKHAIKWTRLKIT